jgi:hypothetical protein
MASALSIFMQSAAEVASASVPDAVQTKPLRTRRQRRSATLKQLSALSAIRDAEEEYRDNIPENLQSGVRYECADSTVELLDQAIDLLEDAF